MKSYPVPSIVRKFSSIFASSGYSLYIVGGAVRDHFLGRKNTDYDFATDAMPKEVMSLFRTVIPTGIKHGTVTVIFEGHHYEVTTFRVDGDYTDMRHPETVSFVRSLPEDLKRRDFTINALAVNAFSGELIDLHEGRQDLALKIIRAIGNPNQRFQEDALRIMRACRFSSQLDFTIEHETAAAMKLLSANLLKVSGERIKDEFFKILASKTPSVGILNMDECRALEVVLPELVICKGVLQKGMHRHDVFHHSLASCDAAPSTKPLVRLAALLHDIGKVETKSVDSDDTITFYQHEYVSERLARNILNRLKCSNEERETVANLIRNHMFHYTPDWTDGAVRRFINRVGKEHIADVFDLRMADQVGIFGGCEPRSLNELSDRIHTVLAQNNALSVKDLAINGNELARMGIPKGPVMGLILKELLETVLDDPSQNSYDRLATIAQGFYKERIQLEDASPLSDS